MSKFLLAGFFALAAIFTLATGALHAQLTSTALSRLYDSSTLAPGSGTVLLPYNRLITPAGTILRFGNGEMENHSLDAVLLPGARGSGGRSVWGGLCAGTRKSACFPAGFDERPPSGSR